MDKPENYNLSAYDDRKPKAPNHSYTRARPGLLRRIIRWVLALLTISTAIVSMPAPSVAFQFTDVPSCVTYVRSRPDVTPKEYWFARQVCKSIAYGQNLTTDVPDEN